MTRVEKGEATLSLLGKELGARAPFSPSDSSNRLLLTHSVLSAFAGLSIEKEENWIACVLS